MSRLRLLPFAVPAAVMVLTLGCGGKKSDAPLVAPTISALTASPTSVDFGAKVVLSWTASGADQLNIVPGVGSVTGKTSVEVTPTATTTYVLTATNAQGMATSSTLVTLNKPAVTSFTPSASSIEAGGKATLRWDAKGGSSVRIEPGVGDVTGKTSVDVNPSVTTTYTIYITNASGEVSSQTTVAVKPGIAAFTGGVTYPGGKATLAWTALGAESLVITPGVGDVTGKTSVDVSPLENTTYTLTAKNKAGETTRQAAVQVAAPSVTGFVATPETVEYGQKTKLTWNVSGAQSVSIAPGVGVVTGKSSIELVPSATTTYTLTAVNPIGTTTATTLVTVPKPAVSNFKATPSTLEAGTTVTLSWEARGARSVKIDNGIGDVTGKNSVAVMPLKPTTYTLTASNDSGDVTAQVTLEVKPVIQSFEATNCFYGQLVTLTWASLGADTLTISPEVGDVTGKSSLTFAPKATTTYTLTAKNKSGEITKQATVTVLAPEITWLKWEELATGKAKLTWEVKGESALAMDNGVGKLTGKTSIEVPLGATYTLTATNGAGSVTKAVETLSLALQYTNPENIAAGEFALVINPALSTNAHVVLELVGPATEVTGRGQALALLLGSDLVTWAKPQVSATALVTWLGSTKHLSLPGTPLLMIQEDKGALQAGFFHKHALLGSTTTLPKPEALSADAYNAAGKTFQLGIDRKLTVTGPVSLTATGFQYLDANRVVQQGVLRVGTLAIVKSKPKL